MDLSERGRRDGAPISLDRRLFMNFTAFRGLRSVRGHGPRLAESGRRGSASTRTVKRSPRVSGSCRPQRRIRLIFVTDVSATLFNDGPPFADRWPTCRSTTCSGGRTAIGYESGSGGSDPLRAAARAHPGSRNSSWAVWYPLQRSKGVLPALGSERQRANPRRTRRHRPALRRGGACRRRAACLPRPGPQG